MRVLYIDDDRVNAVLFLEICRLAEGVEVATAGSCDEALEVLGSFGADLLLVDLNLPDGDGCSLLPRLLQVAGRPVPAYLCSADDRSLTEERARLAGFAGCWSKPLEINHVLAQLRRHAAGTA
jgi:CheY-like chemotaxis protein